MTENTLSSYLFYGVGITVGLVAVATMTLYLNQNQLLYMPNPPGIPKTPNENPDGWKSPLDWKSHFSKQLDFDFEDNLVETSDGEKIHTWLIMHKNSSVPTLIYFHGNAGNMGFRLKNAMYMYEISGLNVLMVDYRGYGNSSGTPTESGLNLDGEAVLRYAVNHPRLKGSPMVCFGRSLGGAVAISLAARYPNIVRAVVVENTFLSIPAMVDQLMPVVSSLKGLILNIKWDSDVKIKELQQPILFISGDRDELVPPSHMTTLHQSALASRLKDLYSVRGGTHNDTWEVAGIAYYKKLKSFLHAAFPEGSSFESNVGEEAFSSNAPSAHIPTMNTKFSVD